MAALHDRADQKAGLAATGAAFQISRSRGDAEWFTDYPAVTADKSLRPTRVLKVGSTRRIIRKVPLKLRQRTRKSQIVALKNVHRRHDTIRPSRSSGDTTSSGCLAQADRHGPTNRLPISIRGGGSSLAPSSNIELSLAATVPHAVAALFRI
jgi:hypothetical protein